MPIDGAFIYDWGLSRGWPGQAAFSVAARAAVPMFRIADESTKNHQCAASGQGAAGGGAQRREYPRVAGPVRYRAAGSGTAGRPHRAGHLYPADVAGDGTDPG